MLNASADRFGALFSQLARADGPAVIHCAGGKDRTGMVAALLLTCLGVDRQSVLDDYQLTARSTFWRGMAYTARLPGEAGDALRQASSPDRASSSAQRPPSVLDFFVASGIAPEAAKGMLGTPRWAMAETLEQLDTAHGGIDSYLLGPAGLTDDVVASLRGRLISQAPLSQAADASTPTPPSAGDKRGPGATR
jgi:hypothetical protein